MNNKRAINVLGIETSCDDTGVAIVNQESKILANELNSQLTRHLHQGGIIPALAREYHLDNIDNVALKAFKTSNLGSVSKDIDAIGVTNRPGLSLSLQIGLNYAKTLAKKYSKPLIPIHHMQAHALMPLLENKTIRFPFLVLLISGGHCLLSIAKRYNDFHLLGYSTDESPGELLDQVGRRLKLRNIGPPYDSISGGASIELLSRRPGADNYKYYRGIRNVPMTGSRTCNFSFTGYRSLFVDIADSMDRIRASGDREGWLSELSDFSASLQRGILVQLFRQTRRAFMYYRMFWRYANQDAFASGDSDSHLGFGLRNLEDPGIDLVISGGVACNDYLTNGLGTTLRECVDDDINVFRPTKSLCSDNGLMIAWNAMLRYQDYLSNKEKFNDDCDPNNSVLFDGFERLTAISTCPIGVDLTKDLSSKQFKLERISHPELKLL